MSEDTADSHSLTFCLQCLNCLLKIYQGKLKNKLSTFTHWVFSGNLDEKPKGVL